MALVDSRSSAYPDVGDRLIPSPGHGSGILGDTGRNGGAEQSGFLRADSTAALLLVAASKWAKKRVCTICTPWASDRVVLVPDPGRIAEVFGGVANSQGLEPGSSPTSGTVLPQVRGFWRVFVWTVSTLLPLI